MDPIARQRERVRKKKEREARQKKELQEKRNMTARERKEAADAAKKAMIDAANKQSSEHHLNLGNVSGYETQVLQEKKKREAEEAAKKGTEQAPAAETAPAAPRKTAFETGLDKAKDILGPEGLRTAEMKDVMARRKQQAEQGIGQEEQLAMKTKLARQMMQAEQTAGLKLGSALGGMTGAATGAQVRSLQAQGLQARAGIERDIFMAQEAAKREGLDKLEETARFDVGQIGKEKEFQSTLGLGMERIDAIREGSFLAAEAASKAGGGGKK